MNTVGQIVRRSFLYLGLAIVPLAIFSLFFFLSIATHIIVPFRWVMLAVFTGLLLFTIIKTDREYWNRPFFWLTCGCVLAFHLALFIPLLRNYPEFRVVWWVWGFRGMVIGSSGRS